MEFDHLFKSDNPKCNGCSQIGKNHPVTCELDYEGQDPVDVLFVSDSLKQQNGMWVPFRTAEYKIIQNQLAKLNRNEYTVGYTASVKCPNITADKFPAKDRKVCRVHLEDSIEHYKPKLVFACGKLAITCIYGKNIDDKKGRGRIDDLEIRGHQFKCMPIIHPWMVVSEPKNSYLFNVDVENGINTVILKLEKKRKFEYEVVDSIARLKELSQTILNSRAVSFDVETTGLNFLKDKIQTMALSFMEGEVIRSIAIPFHHRNNPGNEAFKSFVIKFIGGLMSDDTVIKVMQNCKFDMKMLMAEGIKDFRSIRDTKLQQHLVLEDIPKGLKDLVLYYFPEEYPG